MEITMPFFETDLDYIEFLDFLATLSVEGETFEICLNALKLQTALQECYGKPL